MDLINHYIKNESLVEIPVNYTDLLTEAIGVESLLRGDGRMDTFIDKLESGTLQRTKSNGTFPIKDKSLWVKMKKG